MLDPSLYQTPRLALRPPARSDAAEVFRRIASDPDVTRFVGWPRHTSIEDTQAFLTFSEAEWAKWPAGPLTDHFARRRRHTGVDRTGV
jgi:ribosomal-protein-alanine N-acetyltransferase